MATWIVGIVLVLLLAVAGRYVFRMFRAGKCVGCSECKSGCCHCHNAPSAQGK